MAKWIDTEERWPGSMPGANFTAESLGPWEAVRVTRVSLEVDAGWKIHVMRRQQWRQIGIVYRSREDAMAAAEAAAADPATRIMVAAAEKMEAVAAETWRLASDMAAKAAERDATRRPPAGVN